MKRVKVRETLYTSDDFSELCFKIDKAHEHFGDILMYVDKDIDFSDYISFEVSVDIDDGLNGWSIEGVRWEYDHEFETRKERDEYQKYLVLKEKFKDIDDG